MNKYFHNFLFGISVLPALLIMPAMAVSITEEDTNLNDLFPDGVVPERISSIDGFSGSLVLPNISIVNGSDGEGVTYNQALLVNNDSSLTIGNLSSTNSLSINSSNLGIVSAGNSDVTVAGKNLVVQATSYNVAAQDGGSVTMSAGNLTLGGGNRGISVSNGNVVANASNNMNMNASSYGVLSMDNGSVGLTAKNLSVNAANGALWAYSGDVSADVTNLTAKSTAYTLLAQSGKTLDIDVDNNMIVSATNGSAVFTWAGNVDINTKNLTVTSSYEDTSANQNSPQGAVDMGGANANLSIIATGDINIAAIGDAQAVIAKGTGTDTQSGHLVLSAKNINLSTNSDKWAAVHSANYSADLEDSSKFVVLDIDAENISITAPKTGVAVMSQGIMNINGDTTLRAKDAIIARGDAKLYLNKNTNNSLKMDGDINFNYDKATSGTKVDAIVDVTMSGADSYWTGNTTASYSSGQAPDESYMKVNSVYLTMKNGATWNATKVVDNMNDDTSGSGYAAMNYLTIDNGTVNIADTDRGIVVENASVADATFNGGMLNVGALALTGGENTFNNDVFGINEGSALTIGSDATMNIGSNVLDINSITLDGNMLATLRSGTSQITAATFTGNGTLKLAIRGADTYHVFGGKIFDNYEIESSVYDYQWANENKDLVVTMKSVQDIATDNNLTTETAKAVASLANSSSEQLNDLAVAIQEKLAVKTDEARAEVERVKAAIHPETESVTRSVASSVQSTVTSLATGRMSMPTIGRSGGDAKMTSGGVWVQGIFNKSKQNDAFSGYTRGVAGGLDATFNKVATIGAGYAFAHSDMTGTERDTEIDSSTVFLYGQYKPSAWYVNAVANYTMADYTETGSALGIGLSANYDVDSFGANVATGYDFAGGVTPELALRYMHINSADYISSLGIKNELDDADYLTASIGTKYAFDMKVSRRLNLRPELRYGVKYDVLSDKQVATVTMPGVNSYVLDTGRLSRIGGEFGIGLTMNYRGLDMSLNYDIEAREDYTSQSGRVKFRYNF